MSKRNRAASNDAPTGIEAAFGGMPTEAEVEINAYLDEVTSEPSESEAEPEVTDILPEGWTEIAADDPPAEAESVDADPVAEPTEDAPADMPAPTPAAFHITMLLTGTYESAIKAVLAATAATGISASLCDSTGELILRTAGAARALPNSKPARTSASKPAKEAAAPKERVRSPAMQAVIDLLTSPEGATIAEIHAASGWNNVPSAFHLERMLRPMGLDLDFNENMKPDFRTYRSKPLVAVEG
jgi:hypothetical protein